MKTLFIIDRLEHIKPYKDSSVDLMCEAQARGHEISICYIDDVFAENGIIRTLARQVHLADTAKDGKVWSDHTATVQPETILDVTDFDVVFIRKDPPFDTNYLSLTYLLSTIENDVLFINRPTGVRDVNEKLYSLAYARYAPKTLIAYTAETLMSFAEKYEFVVLKPAYYGSGNSIFKTSHNDERFHDYVDQILNLAPQGPVIAQEFMPEVQNGDTRVMLLNGKPVCGVGRKPPEGDFRANIAAGGSEFSHQLTPHQIEVSQEIGKDLAARGIIFAGLDFIGDKLIEINVTSPTLIQELRKVSQIDFSIMLWDEIETLTS